MKTSELKEHLKPIPDDAEVTYRLFPAQEMVAIVFVLGGTIQLVYIDREFSLPTL